MTASRTSSVAGPTGGAMQVAFTTIDGTRIRYAESPRIAKPTILLHSSLSVVNAGHFVWEECS